MSLELGSAGSLNLRSTQTALRSPAQPSALPAQAGVDPVAEPRPESRTPDTFTSLAGGAGAAAFTQLAGDNTRGLNDPSTASLDLNGRLALQAYRDRQNAGPGPQAALTAGAGAASAQAPLPEHAAQLAQAAALASPMNLLG